MIDTSKFIEPTEKFADQFGEGAKGWFNADLIFFALELKREQTKKELVSIKKQFKDYKKVYGLDLSEEEVLKDFGEYTEADFFEHMDFLYPNK